MLDIFNSLAPFFKDNYRRIHVREYARMRKISPPSASTHLEALRKEHLLVREDDRGYILYSANRENREFIDLSRAYWRMQLEKAGFIRYLQDELAHPVVILFGSLAKAEARATSDIDIAIFSHSKKPLGFAGFEEKLARKIEVVRHKDVQDLKATELLPNILNGYMLLGSW